jgi:Lon protease-like protein
MATLEVPLFPLGVVLFPGTPQLLHIFEPRYRQMLADCLEGDRRFGLSFAKADPGTDPQPQPGDVGCMASVRESRLLADGRSNILAVGEERYVLREYLERDVPYRVAVVETFDDDDLAAPQVEEVARRPGSSPVRPGMHALSDHPTQAIQVDGPPQATSFQIAATLELEAEVKQELLELRSTHERLQRLLRLLRPLNEELGRRVSVHARARGNGKGGPTRDVVTG